MAADKHILNNIIAVLTADSDILGYVGGSATNKIIVNSLLEQALGERNPRFVTVEVNTGQRSVAYPAEQGEAVIRGFLSTNIDNSAFNIIRLQKAIENALEQASGLTDSIDADDEDSTKIRVPFFNKTSGRNYRDGDLKIYICEIRFRYTQSQGESYESSDAGDKPWT